MGSFNVSCTASNLSINYGDNIVFIPLIQNRFVDNISQIITTRFTYNDDLYQPFLLPIKGIYEDYGKIGSIKEDDNTKLIETIYGYSINEITKSICDNEKLNHKEGFEELPKLAGMFVLESIYNDFCSIDFDEYPNKVFLYSDKSYLNSQYVNHTILKKLGFSFIRTEDRKSLYTKNDNIAYLSDYSITINESKNSIFDIGSFIKSWNKKAKDNLSIDMLGNLNYIKEKILSEINTEENNINELKKDSEHKKSYERILNREIKEILNNNLFCNKWNNFDIYTENYIQEKNENILDLLIEMRKFHNIMCAGNILYRPSSNGLQHGSSVVSKFILKSALKHLNK